MRYDDRLITVLQLPVNGRALTRIQWRQLIDLLGTAPIDARGELLDKAYIRLAELSVALSASECAAILSEPGTRLRSPRLVASLTTHDRRTATAALFAAELDAAQWLDLTPALPPRARVWLATRPDLPESVRALLIRLGTGAPGLPETDAQAIVTNATSESDGPPPPASPIPAPPVPQSPTRPSRKSAFHQRQPQVSATDQPVPPSPPLPPPPQHRDTPTPDDTPFETDVSTIIQRIETLRHTRQTSTTATDTVPATECPAAPAPDPVIAFDFASDTEGRIIWSQPATAPMVVGLNLAGYDLADGASLRDLVRRHQPIRGRRLTLAGADAITGEWCIDATARFDPLGGRFIGHAGRFRRTPAIDTGPAAAGESTRLREMLHELRTPVSAIQGFAEIIQQQLFGPAPHEYRALAATIITNSAYLLGGFEEVERFARLDTGAMELAAGVSDLAGCLATIIMRLAPGQARSGGFLWDGSATPLLIPLAPDETERLLWRLLASLAAHISPADHLPVTLHHTGREATVLVPLPTTLAALSDEALFHGAVTPFEPGAAIAIPSAGMFGTGFSLRLAKAEAHAAGGTLQRDDNRLCLTLTRALP